MVETNIILGLIRNDKEFRKGFMQKAKDIYADVISFIANPNCTCKKRVVAYIEENKDAIDSYYQEYSNSIEPEQLSKTLELIAEDSKQKNNTKEATKVPNNKQRLNDVRGEVVEIEPNPFEYKEVIETAKKEKWFYRGLSVTETIKVENEVEKPVWLIFFY